MLVNSRTSLRKYCLTKLGQPVIRVNVSDEQIELCIDDAIQYIQENYFEGLQRDYFLHVLTQTDIANKYVTVDDNIISVVRCFPINSLNQAVNNEFSWQQNYMRSMNDLVNISGGAMTDIYITNSYVDFVNYFLEHTPQIEFKRYMQQVHLECDWTKIDAGSYLLLEVFRTINPDQYVSFFNDQHLKQYCVALIKKQWGTNLKKFSGTPLAGGVEFSGQAIYDEAVAEITEIKEEMKGLEPPIPFYVG
jgi:hypothetical protein